MKTSTLAFLLIFSASLHSQAQRLSACRDDSGLYGYCDKTGKTIIDHKYYDALDFIDGHAAVLGEEKWGIINESGNWMVQPKYDEVYNCTYMPDQILVKIEDKWSLINAYGIQMTREYEVKTPWYEFELSGSVAEFQAATWFSVIRKDKWGVIDINDKIKIPFSYQWTRVIRKEVAGKRQVVCIILKEKDKFRWQKADAETPEVIEYDQFMGEYSDFLFFRKGSEYHILNAITGERVRDAGRSYFNLLDDEDSAGLVNTTGRIIVPFKYQIVDVSKVQMHAVFGFRQELGLCDLTGKILLQPIYQDIREVSSNPAIIAVKNQDGKVALAALEGSSARFISEFKYDYAILDGNGIRIKMGSKVGYLSTTGVETWN